MREVVWGDDLGDATGTGHYRTMKKSDSITALAAALAKAQIEIRAIPKDATNPHFKSKFASLDAIMDHVRPILAKNGLAIVQGAEYPMTNEANQLYGFAVETTLVHSSGEWLSSAVILPITKADPQGVGSALTYGRRYGVSALLALATDDDDDANTASAQRARPASRPATAQPAPTREGMATPDQLKRLAVLADHEAVSDDVTKMVNEGIAQGMSAAKADKWIAQLTQAIKETTNGTAKATR